jgi:biopolymer transport protein ExbD
MAGSNQNNNGLISGINVTPLVDITLVLLVIFMVATKVIESNAVLLDLPKASQSEAVQTVFSVILPAKGPVLVDGRPVTADGHLSRLAKEALGKNPELRAVINADGAVPHRTVLHTLDLLKEAGIGRVAFGALPEEEVRR